MSSTGQVTCGVLQGPVLGPTHFVVVVVVAVPSSVPTSEALLLHHSSWHPHLWPHPGLIPHRGPAPRGPQEEMSDCW